jgi:hypothetical protein
LVFRPRFQLEVLITCVLQFSEALRSNHKESRRIFGHVEIGKTMFCSSSIKNPELHGGLQKFFNNCYLGDTVSVEDRDEVQGRLNFFRGDWM